MYAKLIYYAIKLHLMNNTNIALQVGTILFALTGIIYIKFSTVTV